MTRRFHHGLLIALCCSLLSTNSWGDDAPTVAAEQASFRLADANLSISLVAAEPAVASPVAVAWDEFGGLFVVEMTDYPADGSGGQVKRLEDRDGDGIYEHATLFAEKLAWPSGVLPYKGGILVTSAPNLLYFKDTNGDGKADIREVVLTGFGEGNQQLRVNSPTWGLDNWIYLANGRSGGAVRRPGDDAAKAVNIPRNDLRFQPLTGEIEAIAGFSQFGLPRNDWGDRFPSWNTVPVRHVLLENSGLSQSAQQGLVADILELNDGGRLYALAPAQKRFNAESVAFFNATCGPVINRDAGLGGNYTGNVFVCEPLSSLVHRRRMVPNGPTFKAVRVEQDREFLASAHPWFRPVNLANGPDGALYLVDFCRAWVEHPAFVPEKQRNSVDFREGHLRGRIWRIAENKLARNHEKRWPGQFNSRELAALLEHNNSWQRDTAQRLIVERQDKNAVAPLESICKESQNPVAVTQALWTLQGLNALNADLLKMVSQSAIVKVRMQAVRLAGLNLSGNQEILDRLANDETAGVRFEVVRAISAHPSPSSTSALLSIAGRDADSPWMTAALLRAADENPLQWILQMLENRLAWLREPNEFQADLLANLAQACVRRNQAEKLIRELPRFQDDMARTAIVDGLLRSDSAKKTAIMKQLQAEPEFLKSLIATAEVIVKTDARPPRARSIGFEVLAELAGGRAGEFMMASLDAGVPDELQSTMAAYLPKLVNKELLETIFSRWDSISIVFRRYLVSTMIGVPGLAAELLNAVESEKISALEIDPTSRAVLKSVGDAAFQKRAAAVLNTTNESSRADVLKRYEPALALAASAAKGKLLFQQNCISCHAYQGVGAKVGPELAGVAGKTGEELLVSILDPARDAVPDGVGVLVLTKDGRTLSGLLAEENANVVRLRQAQGREETIPRADVEMVRSTGRSLMPEGLEAVLSPQDLADLIAFLKNH